MNQLRILELNVNGELRQVAAAPCATLIDLLREQLKLMGTKEGCGTGECGSCTVLIDGRPELACLTLAADCEGKSILTIEGLETDGKLTPVQQAFIDAGAVQCGFCTPGMVLSTTALLAENPRPGRAEIAKALEGNLCRCTGYNKIVDAVERAAAAIAGSESHG